MVDVALSIGRLFAALFLVALNGFFVASEFAYVRIRSTAVDRLVEEGATGAGTLREAMDNLDDYLATTQLGITIASLGLGWLGEPAVAALLEPLLSPYLGTETLHLVAFAVGFSVITFLHVVFGELAPKTFAIAQPERIALLVALPMKAFYYLLVPGIIVFNGTANAFTRMLGVPPASESEETLTEEEILTVLSRSGQEGHVDKEEVEIIERVFELNDVPIREAMVPRPDVVTVDADDTLADLRALVIETGHTRYPVLDADDADQVLGFVDVKDILRADESVDRGEVTAGDIARDLPVIPETGRLDDVLAEFQDGRSQMAAVIDEWGVFEGIATVEDVVEHVVGDIQDTFDEPGLEPSIEQSGGGTHVVDGGVSVAEVNETLEADFEVEDFGTIGGLVLDRLGRAPEVGDEVAVDGYRLTVADVEGARVEAVEIEPDGDENPADDPDDESN